MAEVIQFQNIPEHENEAWVGVGPHGHFAPIAERADFIVNRTVSGLFTVAVRGYSEGAAVLLNFENGDDPSVEINGSQYFLPEVATERVAAIDSARVLDYLAAMKLPEEPVNSDNVHSCAIARIFEQGLVGVWNIDHNEEGQAAAKLVFQDADSVGIHPYNKSVWDSAAKSYTQPDPAIVPMQVFREGPMITLEPYGQRSSQQSYNALSDRMTRLHWAVKQMGYYEEEFKELYWARDAYENGLVSPSIRK